MNKIPFFLQIIFIFFAASSYAKSDAANSQQVEANAEQTIEKLYHRLHRLGKSSMPARIEWISAQFLGKPYVLGPLGEGLKGRFDQSPKYSTSSFDCETFVTTVLAIALSNHPNQFIQCMSRLRYKNDRIKFIERNHFTSLDWNPNNQKKGLLKDITNDILDKNHQSVAKTATAIINKPSWYQFLKTDSIKLASSTKAEQDKRLQELKKLGSTLEIKEARIPYLPLDQLFDEQGKANEDLFKQIPNAALIEIVRPNWDLRKTTGTCLNVSHMGLAIWSKGVLYFREASSLDKKVIDIPLSDYLRSALKSPTIKGINVQVVLPETASENPCGVDNKN